MTIKLIVLLIYDQYVCKTWNTVANFMYFYMQYYQLTTHKSFFVQNVGILLTELMALLGMELQDKIQNIKKM